MTELPYGPADDRTSGFAAGVATSEERARRADQEGTTSLRQKQVLLCLDVECRERGVTWKELADRFGWHHGQASGILSNLHKAGRIARLTERRHRCYVYVLPEDVLGRDTQPQGRPRQPEDEFAVALIQAEAAILRVQAALGPCTDYAFDSCLIHGDDPLDMCQSCKVRHALGPAYADEA